MPSLPHRALTYAFFVVTHFGAFALMAIAGFAAVLRQRPREFILYVMLLLANSGLFLTFDQPGAYFQLLPSFMVYGLLCGYGCRWFTDRLSASFQQWRLLGRGLPVVAFAILWTAQVKFTWGDVNLRGNHRASQDVAEVLQQAPPGSVVIAGFDQILFTLWYYRFVEGIRPDIAIEHTGKVDQVMGRYQDRPHICPMFPPRRLPPGYYFEPVGTFGCVLKGKSPLRYVETAELPSEEMGQVFAVGNGSVLSLCGAKLKPRSMRREAMATLFTYWRLAQKTQDRIAVVCVFTFQGTSTPAGGADGRASGGRARSLSIADRALLSAKQFGWTQYHLLANGTGTDTWQPGRIVEDRMAVRPPWRVVAGVYSIRVTLVPEREKRNVGDSPLPRSISTRELPEIGEIEIYMQ